MHLMLIVKNTIQVARREITFLLVNSLLLIFVYNLYMDKLIIFYPLLLSGTVIVVYAVIRGIALTGFYKRLEEAQTSAQVCVFDDKLQVAVLETISRIHKKYFSQITKLQAQITSRNELFTQLIHALKSSISVIELAINEIDYTRLRDTPLFDIDAENKKLKKNIEQALNIFRLDEFASDYIPERVDLARLTMNIINEHKRDFIYAEIYPKLNGSAFVYTDAKWCGVIIEQVISNAIKYSKAGDNVIFDIEEIGDWVELRVTDSGIGIPPEDLPRVFDMYFTGKNGRQGGESTGIGLFMAKHIADRLESILSVDSEIDKGTTVTLAFHNLTKM